MTAVTSLHRLDGEPEGVYLERVMTALGVVQRGAGILTRTDLPRVALPRERAIAVETVELLRGKADEVERHYPFKGGMGLAAPQIGLARRAAIVRLPDGAEVVLFNPVVVEEAQAGATHEFEGCLSFFGVRGRPRRPQWIVVEHAGLDGVVERRRFDGADARLVAHEIDHLDGVLYADRLVAGDRLVPVEEYRVFNR